MERYDEIGIGYAQTRRSDPRIQAQIERALSDAVSVVNVGAGAGSYESPRRKVIAIEPAETMIRQRARDAAPAIIGTAEQLPMADKSVDAATAFFTVHHWKNVESGLRELARVARQCVVIMTYVPGAVSHQTRWLTHEYFPGIAAHDDLVFPPLSTYQNAFATVRSSPLLIPHDCVDGFLDAYWSRPESYLDEAIRAGMSGFRNLDVHECEAGVARLREDLKSGSWDARHAALRQATEIDLGVRLVTAAL